MSGPFFDPINYLTDKEYLAVNVWISQEDHFPEVLCLSSKIFMRAGTDFITVQAQCH